ncbi:GntR family transcriptional regulator [Nocardia sp. NPDC004278]|uniref:GntR family transcriptional regulator n=1 Tax=Nocardia sp. NPDC004604 TaxID=3157013 RepID=UPI0033A0F700
MVATWATKTDAAYAWLRGQILDGSLPPGSALDQERITLELGLSTTPLREALRRLEAEGLLTQIAHREMRVPPLTKKEIRDTYDIRLQLDPYAAKIGAARASQEIRDQVVGLREFRPGATIPEMVAQHKAVHRLMYAAADNQPLTDLLDTLWDRSGRYIAILLKEASELRLEHYRDVVNAFVAADSATVARLLKASLVESRDALVARLDG